MELKLIDATGKSGGVLNVSDTVFGRPYNEALVHQAVTAYLANARSGDRAQKGRSDVAKSTRKPWRQKGTGRARSGMASSPIWRGGGRVFPNSPEENFTQKINRRMYRAAISVILSQLVREDRLSVIEALDVDQPKTKQLAEKMVQLGLKDAPVLLITDEMSESLYLSSRNLSDLLVLETQQANPHSLLRFKQVLMTKAAVANMEEMLG